MPTNADPAASRAAAPRSPEGSADEPDRFLALESGPDESAAGGASLLAAARHGLHRRLRELGANDGWSRWSPDRLRRLVAAGAVVLALGAAAAGWWAVRSLASAAGTAPSAAVDLYDDLGGSSPPASTPGRGSPATAPGPTSDATADPTSAGDTESRDRSTVPPGVHVHAAGAVIGPGLYRLRADARVADLIAAAGGLAPDADRDRINLAAPVVDGSRVYVPHRGEAAVPSVATDASGSGSGPDPTRTGGDGPGRGVSNPATSDRPVNLNTATVDQLDTLPGIGPATAQAIVDYRAQHGSFRSVDDLVKVRGIGPAKLADLRPRATV